MKSFQQLVNESIWADEHGKVRISYGADKAASTHDVISNYIKFQPYHTGGQATGGYQVYSVYSYKPSEVSTMILKALKGQPSSYKADPKDVQLLVDKAAKFTADELKKLHINILVYPRSSSPFTKDYVHAINKHDSSLQVIDDVILKREAGRGEGEIEKFADSVIYKDHPKYKELTPKSQKQIRDSIIRNVKKNLADGKGAVISLKDALDKKHMMFVRGFMELKSHETIFELMGKNVAIIDDVISSGATFADMARAVEYLEPRSVVGFTMFKSGSSK